MKLYQYINVLSLDVVGGAVICSLALAHFLDINMPSEVPIVLGLTVWVIYTFDRLMDVKKSAVIPESTRHSFHAKYFRPLAVAMVLSLLLITLLLFRLPSVTVVWGTVLGCVVLIYFLMLHLIHFKWLVHKEFVISVIYAAGVFMGPISLYHGTITFGHITFFLFFMCVALMNLLIFSLYDVDFDRQAGFSSLAISLGESVIHPLIRSLSILAMMLLSLTHVLMPMPLTLLVVLGLMWLVLTLVYALRAYPVLSEHYRWLGDGVFLLPLLYIL